MRALSFIFIFMFFTTGHCIAEQTSIQQILQDKSTLILKSSRKTIEPAIDAVVRSGLPQAKSVLEAWKDKKLWMKKHNGLFFLGKKIDKKNYELIDFETGTPIGIYKKSELKQIKPNSGIRALIANALVRFQLSDRNPNVRITALKAIEREPSKGSLIPLRASINIEPDPKIKEMKVLLERLLTISFDQDEKERLDAINDVSGNLDIKVRGTLNRLLTSKTEIFSGELPTDLNIAKTIGYKAIGVNEAYDLLVRDGLAPKRLSQKDIKKILTENITNGTLNNFAASELNTISSRLEALEFLVQKGIVANNPNEQEILKTLEQYKFVEIYAEKSSAVTSAAKIALEEVSNKVAFNKILDLSLDAISLASIYFLAAIGLAVTFGVMGVINMAHGEFIMMGAYTGYVVQQFITDHTISIIVAIPLAFLVTFSVGVLMERLVIRWLYKRPLETLLATFGISIALQQLAKNVFGTQARPLTSPQWLDGALVLNDVVSISYIRIAIFVLAILFLIIFLFIITRTRLGLETRAVTQNAKMAASMGINTDKINMLTFGLGSGIAGVAGVAIGLFAKVTSELGSDYIVQSFMTVVVGGVGNIWGTLAGAAMIGVLQKIIEVFNPSNTLAAQTYMIIFIIIFIQFRPRGIIALKGRAVGD
ncbi:MAG: urea ABC transporter permease subunit UrtB [Planktomarina sp.]|nr:urea ABC transporter permease subunit UrtB [Planktomarina sp.]